MIGIVVSKNYRLDGLNEDELKEVRKAVETINSFIEDEGDKIYFFNSGFATSIEIKISKKMEV